MLDGTDPKLREFIEELIQKHAVMEMQNHLTEKYNLRGPFVPELTITLDFCLRPKDTRVVIQNLRDYKLFLMMCKLDKEIMIIEEVFSKCYYSYTVKETRRVKNRRRLTFWRS